MHFVFSTITDFLDPDFAEEHEKFFRRYAEYRIHGYHKQIAFRRVFNPTDETDTQSHLKADAIECNPFYEKMYKDMLGTVSVSDMWNTKLSINETLRLIRDPMCKETVKMSAIKELNVLVGIVVVDENGKTKAGSSLDDFYRREGIEKEAEKANKLPH